MKIYVASSWRNVAQPGVVAALRNLGHEVYDFRNPGPGKSGFDWKGIDDAWQRWSPAQWREALRHPVAIEHYGNDRGGMDWADVCVLLLPSGRSAHLEAGFMAGQGKPVFTLAIEPVEAELMNLLLGPPEQICTTIGELAQRLAEVKATLAENTLVADIEQLAAALDLSTWTETHGAGSVDAIVCPHCRERYAPEALRGLGLYYCGGCRRPFNVREMQTPLGKGWMTEADPETERIDAHGYDPLAKPKGR